MLFLQNVLKIRKFYYLHNFRCFTQDSDIESKRAASYFKSKKGGSVNCVHLLGTVTGVQFFPLQRDPSRNWALVFIKTNILSPDSTLTDEHLTDETESSIQTDSKITRASNRVHLFKPGLVTSARDMIVGDRVFVSGFLSYYKIAQESKDGKPSSKIRAIVADKVIYMGHQRQDG